VVGVDEQGHAEPNEHEDDDDEYPRHAVKPAMRRRSQHSLPDRHAGRRRAHEQFIKPHRTARTTPAAHPDPLPLATIASPIKARTQCRAANAGSLTRLSESLRRHRPDDGIDPAGLSRADMTAFSSDLAHLEARGRLSRAVRRKSLEDVDRFLRDARGMGLSGRGQPLGRPPRHHRSTKPRADGGG
jgi:hypothetical protein